ncbi:MAG: NmrA family NAD(P)-binding protein [Betaproteobacteria bacterium]|nr:NmrA family NAD(P)-binding protein [Betaproteobacteria bacterium]
MTASIPTVLILGAHGRFGQAVTAAFVTAGWHVRAQSRRPDARWPAGVTGVCCDALQAAEVARAAQGVDVIINALNPLYTDWERQARPLAANALAATEVSGALLMFPGNVYNFGKNLPPRLTTATPEISDNPKARIRIEIEQQMQAAAARGVNSVVVRAGDFFGGAARGAWFDLVIVKSLSKGKLVYPGPTDQVHSWAYLPDLAQVFVRLAEQRKQLRGAQRFHFGGHAITGSELHSAMQQASGKSLRLSAFPWGIVRLIAPFAPMMKATLAMRYLWQRPHVLEDASLRALLGKIAHTPLPEALAQALDDLAQNA